MTHMQCVCVLMQMLLKDLMHCDIGRKQNRIYDLFIFVILLTLLNIPTVIYADLGLSAECTLPLYLLSSNIVKG